LAALVDTLGTGVESLLVNDALVGIRRFSMQQVKMHEPRCKQDQTLIHSQDQDFLSLRGG
jgi:hypothetical protein